MTRREKCREYNRRWVAQRKADPVLREIDKAKRREDYLNWKRRQLGQVLAAKKGAAHE